jgi:hypothetical protein
MQAQVPYPLQVPRRLLRSGPFSHQPCRTRPLEDQIERTLDWRESTLMSFSLRNMPKSLGMIPARSIYDYNSLNYMRATTEVARRARLFSYRVFGMVPPIPDNDNRNAEDWGV